MKEEEKIKFIVTLRSGNYCTDVQLPTDTNELMETVEKVKKNGTGNYKIINIESNCKLLFKNDVDLFFMNSFATEYSNLPIGVIDIIFNEMFFEK